MNNTEIIRLPGKIEHIDQNSIKSGISKELKNTMKEAVENLEDIEIDMQSIQVQNGWTKFWRKGKNIDTITENIEKQVQVQQITLQLILLVMGACCNLNKRYNELGSNFNEGESYINELNKVIDEQMEVNKKSEKIPKYLMMLKEMMNSMNDRCLKIDEIIEVINIINSSLMGLKEYTNGLEESISETRSKFNNRLDDSNIRVDNLESNFHEKIHELEGSYNEKIKAYDQKIESLEERIEFFMEENNDFKNKFKINKGISLISVIIAIVSILLSINLF